MKRPRLSLSRSTLAALLGFGLLAWAITQANPLAVAVAVVVGWLMLKAGLAVLRGFAAPLPEPPPPGELRKVKITYRCSICGTEVRMTVANDEMPEPPRHCLDEMDLVAPVE